MKYLIYYEFDPTERTLADVEHLRQDVTEESIQEYLQNKWSAWILELMVCKSAATKEEARDKAIQCAYGFLATDLREGLALAKDFMKVEFEDATETLSSDELTKRLVQLHGVQREAAE